MAGKSSFCRRRSPLTRGDGENWPPTTRKGSRTRLAAALITFTMLGLAACGYWPNQGRVFFIEPANGAQVTSPFKVRMGSEGLTIEPATEDGDYPAGHGHHHIIIDAVLPNLDQPIPKDSIQHLHYGKAQIGAVLDLQPGKHTLKLLFAKGNHVPWTPVMSDSIEVTVVD